MIYVDWKSYIIATCMAAKTYENHISAEMVRPHALRTLMDWKRKYETEFGDMVVCDDHLESWRRNLFPNYKHGRRLRRKQDDPDTWKSIYEVSNTLKGEIDKYGVAIVFTVPKCEADDTIAILSKFYQEPTLIISNDKDFHQLHKLPHIRQYAPVKNILYRADAPEADLALKIIRGDTSDSIPNILSPDDIFVEGSRQSPISLKRLEEYRSYYDCGEFPESIVVKTKGQELVVPMQKNFQRNRDLIDFRRIPKSIAKYIIQEFKKKRAGADNGSKLHMYLIQNNIQ